VELGSLSVADFEAILTSTHASLVKQYQALLATEGVTLEISPEGVRRLAQIAFDVNESTENIGARRLHTVMERLLDEIADAPKPGPDGGSTRLVNESGPDLAKNEDLSFHPVARRFRLPDGVTEFAATVEDQRIDGLESQVGDRRELHRCTTGHEQCRLLAIALEQLAVLALDSASNRVRAAAHQSSLVLWKSTTSPVGTSSRPYPSPAP
jgi:hypothetical protein